MPSLKPNRLRGVCCAEVVRDVRPKPICDHRMRARPKAMRLRLRIAWTATCGSSAHAWMHRSPSDSSGSRSSPRNAGSRSSTAGRRSAIPNRSTPSLSNRVGPNPKVMVSPVAPRPIASPVSSGGASGDPPTAPVALTSSPRVMRAAAYDQSCSSEIRSSRSVRAIMSNAAKCRWSCTGVVMPAWCAPKKSKADAACPRSRQRVRARDRRRRRRLPRSRPRRRRRRPARAVLDGSLRTRLRARLPAAGSEFGPASSPGSAPCPSGFVEESLTSLQHGHRELRQRLGQRIDEVGELALVVFGELAIADESGGERTVRGEGLLEGRVAGIDLLDEGRARRRPSPRRNRARARTPSSSPRRWPRSPTGRSPTTSPPRRRSCRWRPRPAARSRRCSARRRPARPEPPGSHRSARSRRARRRRRCS